MPKQVSISAPARLHFGLLAVGNLIDRKFGGLGLMIDAPRTEVTVSPSNDFSVSISVINHDEAAASNTAEMTEQANQELKEKTLQFTERWLKMAKPIADSDSSLKSIENMKDLGCRIDVKSHGQLHCGLGSGTQLGMAVATALFKAFELTLPSPTETSIGVGRGARSAIGSHGFSSGGLLLDRGLGLHDKIAPLDMEVEFPSEWPILIAIPEKETGLHGTLESNAFQTLPDTRPRKYQEMIELVRNQILPGVLNKDYSQFADALYQFNHNSGLYYESVQGGPFNGAQVTKLVDAVRQFGVPATGQSSWGPAVFAISPNEETACRLRRHLQSEFGSTVQLISTRVCNQGAFEVVV